MMIIDAVAHQALRNPQGVAVCMQNADVSFQIFNRSVNQVANRLKGRLSPGTRVAVMVDNRYLHWLLLLAVGRLGAVSVSIDPDKHELLLGVVRPGAVLADRAVTGQYAPAEIRVTSEWLKETMQSGSAAPLTNVPRLEDPVRIALSSGTTGLPKKILFTHAAALQRAIGGAESYPVRQHRRFLSLFGIDTAGGYAMSMRTWLLGGAVCLFPADPSLLATRNVAGIAGAPRQLQVLLSRLPKDFAPLPRLSITLGGGRISKELSRQLRQRLSPDVTLTYGSTEAWAVASCPLQLLDRDPDLSGILLPCREVEAISSAGESLPPGEVGEIRIRTPEVCPGYLEDDEATARSFRNGWFYPGDVGSVSAAGELKILGRVDDVMNAGGVKVAPDVIEEILMTVPGILDVGVFSMEHDRRTNFWAAIVSGGAVDFSAAQAAVNRRLASGNALLRFVSVPSIPRNAMGKIQRLELRKQAEALSAGEAAAPARALQS